MPGAVLVTVALGVAGLRGQGQGRPGSPATQRPVSSSPTPLQPLPVSQVDTRQLPPLHVTQLDDRLPAPTGQAFSVSFAEPQPIRDVLLLMLKDTGLSVVIDPDVAGTFTGELANVTLKQALDITLSPLGVAYTLERNVLHVFKRPAETRFFSVNHVATVRHGQRTTSVPTGASGGEGSASVTSFDASDFYQELGTTIAALLSPDGRFTIDRKAGLVQVTDLPERLDRVANYLELAELRATRQVQIDVVLLEVELPPSSAGIDWRAVLAAAGSPTTRGDERSAPPGAAFTFGAVPDIDVLLGAFRTQGTVTVLARPRVAAMNNEPAIVRATTERPTGAAQGGQARNRERDGGPTSPGAPTAEALVLSVTPQVSADGIIQMSVAPVLARESADGSRPAGDDVVVHGTDTVVRVRKGETVLLGGLMRMSTSTGTTGPGGLAQVPLVGRVAKPEPQERARKSELVILLTPTII